MKQEPFRLRRRLTLRLTAVIAFILIAFTLLSGFLYNIFMQEATVEHYSRVLQRHAYAISQNLHDLLSPGGYQSLDETRWEVSWDTLTPYLAMTEQITRCNVYLVDTQHSITGYFDGILQTLNGVTLSPYLEQSIALGFMGKTPFIRSGSGSDMRLTTSAPIMDQFSRVLGVVLLDVSLRELGLTQVSGAMILSISVVISFALALILAFILSLVFTNPIQKTREAALRLASGQYETRLPVKRNDEVGQLASSVNVLAERLENARERDRQLQKRQQEFFSTVSHELRTPVTVIRGSAESLADGIIELPEDKQSAYRQIIKECAWLQKLIADLLELSRLQDAGFAIETQDVDLSDLLSDIAMSAGALCAQKGVTFVCQEPRISYIVRGDRQRLRQMFMAVIDNAVKFTAAGRSVTLALSDSSPAICVSDEGSGIPPSEIDHIFDRFYHSRRLGLDGTGLGLALVHEIARRHDVAINVQSTLGQGTVFTFTFKNYHNAV